MIIVVFLAFVWSLYMILWLFRAGRSCLQAGISGAKTASLTSRPALGSVYDPGLPDGPAWSQLDDIQLTRLLISATPPTEPRGTRTVA